MTTPPTYPEQETEVEHAEWRQTLLSDEPDVDLDALLARTRATVEADRGATVAIKRLSTPARIGLVLGAAGATAGLTLVAAARPDLATLSMGHLALELGGSLVAALVAVALAMRPEWRPEARPAVAWGALGFAVGVPALLAAIPAPGAGLTLPADLWLKATIGCFGYATVMALAVVGTWRLVERRKHAGALQWATALAGACAVGTLSLQLHCPVTELSHLLLGHGAVGLVWAALGGLVAWGFRK